MGAGERVHVGGVWRDGEGVHVGGGRGDGEGDGVGEADDPDNYHNPLVKLIAKFQYVFEPFKIHQ
jgi:hypothetical protein